MAEKNRRAKSKAGFVEAGDSGTAADSTAAIAAEVAVEIRNRHIEHLEYFGLGEPFVKMLEDSGIAIVAMSGCREGLEVAVLGNGAGFGSFLASESDGVIGSDTAMDFVDEARRALGLHKPNKATLLRGVGAANLDA